MQSPTRALLETRSAAANLGHTSRSAKRWRLPMLALSLLAVSACQPKDAPEKRPALLADANLVLILIDTLRADHLSAFGYQRPTTPFLGELATRSIAFDDVVATASQTVPSMASLWTGLYPARHANQFFSSSLSFRVPARKTKPRLDEGLTLLSEHLLGAGYRTGGFVTNPWLKREYGFAQGFEVYREFDQKLAASKRYAKGPAVNAAALEQLEQWREAKFFLYLHYMDVHRPYRDDRKYADALPPPADPQAPFAEERADYEEEIRAVDDYIQQVFEALERVGRSNDTLVVISSDHGEEFGERSRIGHGNTLYQEVIHVPLLFAHPQLQPFARRIQRPVSLVDVAPTILDLLGCPSDASEMDGRSLTPLLEATPVADVALFSELGQSIAVRRGDKKVVRTIKGYRPGDRAFDLAVDPDEKSPLDANSTWARELSGLLDRQLARRTEDREDLGTIDPATEERVRALGYGGD